MIFLCKSVELSDNCGVDAIFRFYLWNLAECDTTRG